KGPRAARPRPWPEKGDRRIAANGDELDLRSRLVELDPLTQRFVMEMRATEERGGELLRSDERLLAMTLYFTPEVVLMLERAGFADVQVRAGYEDRPAMSVDDFVVFVARK